MEANRPDAEVEDEEGARISLLTDRIEEIERVFENVNQEFSENLRLFVERVMLFRVTRAEKKNSELEFFLGLLKDAVALSNKTGEEESSPREEVQSTEGPLSRLANFSEAPHIQSSALFSAMLEATENLNPKELLYLLERLRTAPIFKSGERETP